MTDRPILFSAPMVRALISDRKTMTRRVITPSNFKLLGHDFRFHRPDRNSLDAAFCGARKFRWIEGALSWVADPHPCLHHNAVMVDCRGRTQYAPGDRLWVRETWATVNTYGGPGWAYKADGEFIQPEYDGEDFGAGPSFDYEKYPGDYSMWIDDLLAGSAGHRWTPSIHMPRRASRLTLIVSNVRVERLQDISEEDAISEGVECDSDGWRDYLFPHSQCCSTARNSFCTLWDSINGPGAWEANPWVSVTSFAVHQQNIDQMEAA